MKKILFLLAASFAFATHPKSSVPVTPRDVPQSVKNKVFAAAGIPKSEQHLYVIDHKIPLELGGSNDIKNLQAQTIAAGKAKDKIERELTAKVRAGTMTLAEAQAEVAKVK